LLAQWFSHFGNCASSIGCVPFSKTLAVQTPKSAFRCGTDTHPKIYHDSAAECGAMQQQSLDSYLTSKLFILSTLIALSLGLCNVSIYSLCLSAGKIRLIVWAELAASISLPLAANGYKRLCQRFSNHAVQTGIFTLSTVVLLASAVSAPHVSVDTLSLPLLIFAKYHAAFSNLAFWNLATSRQRGGTATSSLGLVSAGFPLGWMLGGLIHLAFGKLVSADVQLLFSALTVLLSTIVFRAIRLPIRESPLNKNARGQCSRSRNKFMPSNPRCRQGMLYVLAFYTIRVPLRASGIVPPLPGISD